MKNENGYTLIELLIVTAIISILAATALPQFYPFKTRAYDADAKANLHNVFLSCKGYWTFTSSNNPCVLNIASSSEYGFVQSAAVEVTLGSGNNDESNFFASSSHLWSSNVYVIDYRGVITLSGSGSSGSGSSGNGGKGCSEPAKNAKGGNGIGGSAKGGCSS